MALLSAEALAGWRRSPDKVPEQLRAAIAEDLLGQPGARLNQLLREVFSAVLSPESPSALAPAALRWLQAHQPQPKEDALQENLAEIPAFQSAVCDVLWLLWTRAEAGGTAVDPRAADRFAAVGKLLLETGVLSVAMCIARLPRGMLGHMQVYANPRLRIPVLTAMTRYKSQVLYAQTKFNLLREESEGYAKLVTALEQEFTRGAEQSEAAEREALVPALVSRLRSLIGFFDLDPNRVLDLVLSVYERHLRYRYVSERTELLVGAVRQLFNPDSVVHLLGFKFRGLRDQTPVLPQSAADPRFLCRLAAILLREGVISLERLYPYLHPSDEEFASEARDTLAAQLRQAKAITTVSLNAPSGDAPPPEDGPTVGGRAEPRTNQKLALLHQCLHVRALGPAQALLGHLQNLRPVADRGVGDALISLVNGIVEPYYAPLAGQWRLMSPAAPPQAVFLPSVKAPAGAADGPAAMEVDGDDEPGIPGHSPLPAAAGFARAVLPWLRWLQVYLYKDPVLFAKVCRVMAHGIRLRKVAAGAAPDFAPLPEEEELLLKSLVPAFSMLSGNVGAATELWSVLGQFGYPYRYRVYGFWKSEMYDEHPELASRRAVIQRRTNYFKRRVTKHNAGELSRQLMKFAASNPVVVFPEILGQLQMFGNMVAPLVDCFRRSTPLAFDVIPFLLLETLANRTDAEKFKDDGVNEAAWFQNLASFAGMFFRKYHQHVAPDSLLVFIRNQLQDERFADLLLLRELIASMAGIECTDEPMVSPEQLEGLAGGPTLRAQTISRQLKSHSIQHSANSLFRALVRNNLVLDLYALLQQHKQHVVYRSETGNLAVLGSWLDRVQSSIAQLMDFVSAATPGNREYLKLFASVPELALDLHLGHDAALWALGRSLQLAEAAGVLASPAFSPPVPEATESSEAKDGDGGTPKPPSEDSPAAAAAARTEGSSKYGPPARMLEAARRLLPESVWQSLSPNLFVTFWSLGLYDLHLPRAAYETQIKAVEAQLADIEAGGGAPGNPLGSGGGGPFSPGPGSGSGSGDTRKTQERLRETLAKLKSELKEQSKITQETLLRMKLDRRNWGNSEAQESLAATNAFFTTCVLPRVLLSSADAVYCGKFLRLLHQVGAEHLPYVFSVDAIVRSLGALLSCCTPFEATRLGRFLQVLFAQLQVYQADRQLYARECLDNPAFFRPPQPDQPSVDHDRFTDAVYRWHKLLLRMFLGKLAEPGSGALNALLMLSQIQKYFPVVEQHCQQLVQRVEALMELDEAQFKVVGTSYNRSLLAARANWQSLEQFSPWTVSQRRPAVSSSSSSSSSSRAPPGNGGGSGGGRESRGDARPAAPSQPTAASSSGPGDSERRPKPLRAAPPPSSASPPAAGSGGRERVERGRSASPAPASGRSGRNEGGRPAASPPASSAAAKAASASQMADDDEDDAEANSGEGTEAARTGGGSRSNVRRKRRRDHRDGESAETGEGPSPVSAAAASSAKDSREKAPPQQRDGEAKRLRSAEPEPDRQRAGGPVSNGGSGSQGPSRPRGRGALRAEELASRSDSPPRGGRGDRSFAGDGESDRDRGRRRGGGFRGRR